MDNLMEQLAQVLRQLRKSAGYSQAELAEKLGVGRTAYVYYETGKALPALPTVRLLMELYQVSADAFLYPERYLAENRQAAEAGEA
jgi:transcriptional regulator with XRE-family HTH domain